MQDYAVTPIGLSSCPFFFFFFFSKSWCNQTQEWDDLRGSHLLPIGP